MPTRRQALQIGAIGGALIGTAAGWAAGALSVPGLEAPLAGAGTYVGQKAAARMESSVFYRRLRRQRTLTALLRRKAQLDLRRLCVQTPSSLGRALRTSNLSLSSSGVISDAQLEHFAPDVLDDFDHFSHGPVDAHVRELLTVGDTIRVSCPALFVGALLALHALSRRLAGYGISLTVDDGAISSKEQIRHLDRRGGVDFAVMAESAYYLSPGTANVTARYARLMPCYSQEDCLLAIGDGSTPNWSSKVYFHEGSTAEVLLRAGPLWGRPSTRSVLDTAGDIVPFIGSLDRGAFVTVWEPITTAMTRAYTDVAVVPGSRFDGYVSLFAEKEWFHPARQGALAAMASLLMREWRGVRLTNSRLAEIAKPAVLEAIDELCGVSYLFSRTSR